VVGNNDDVYPFDDPFGSIDSSHGAEFAIYATYGNVSGTPKIGAVPVGSGSPFFTDNNPQVCPNLVEDGSCTLSWNVTANGDFGSYEFFVIYDSDDPNVISINSDSIDVIIINSCSLEYDEDCDEDISGPELGEAISAWFTGEASVSTLIDHFRAWRINN